MKSIKIIIKYSVKDIKVIYKHRIKYY